MTLRYLLDTNTASFIVRGSPSIVLDRLAEVRSSQIAISSITEAELLYGLARRPEATTLRKTVTAFLRKISILPWRSDAAECYAELRAALEVTGRPLGALDALIAADLILVSNDQGFRRVSNLKLQDWSRSVH